MVFGYVADEAEAPSLVGLIGDIRLVVKEVRPVFALGL